MDGSFMEYNPETETYESEQSMWGEMESGGMVTGEVLSESQEMSLAAELLELRDEAELDHFLGA